MWEWRVFGPSEELGPLPASALRMAETRQDLYVLLGDDVGVKVRARNGEARCEVKQRFSSDPEGPEEWTKIFEQRLPLDGLWAEELFSRLGLSKAPAPIANPEELASALGARTLLVSKAIEKVPHAPALALERSEIEIAGRRLATLCIEAPTRAICLETGRSLGLGSFRAASYPEWLRTL